MRVKIALFVVVVVAISAQAARNYLQLPLTVSENGTGNDAGSQEGCTALQLETSCFNLGDCAFPCRSACEFLGCFAQTSYICVRVFPGQQYGNCVCTGRGTSDDAKEVNIMHA